MSAVEGGPVAGSRPLSSEGTRRREINQMKRLQKLAFVREYLKTCTTTCGPGDLQGQHGALITARRMALEYKCLADLVICESNCIYRE